MTRDSTRQDGQSHDHGEDMTLTRRAAMALFGGTAASTAAGTVAGANEQPTRKEYQNIDAQGYDLRNIGSLEAESAALGNIFTAARKADVVVWKDDEGVFHADGREEHVASGEDFIAVTQAAVDSLTDDRDWKERVAVVSPATVGPVEGAEGVSTYQGSDQIKQIELPSYTVLDVPTTIRVEDAGEQALVVPIAAYDADHVEIPRARIVGNPRFGMFLRSVSNLRLGEIDVEMTDTSPSGGIGVRIDGFAHGRGEDTVRCTDLQVDSVYVENAGGHAFETYAVDRLQVGQVIANGTTGGCGVLLNETTDTTVGTVIGKEIDPGGGYAGFRVANGTHDVTCDQVVVRGGARGIFGVSGCYNVTIGEVNISEMLGGMLIQDCQNFTIEGGVVRNCDWQAIRVDSRDSFQHDPAEGITLRDIRMYDDRPEADRDQSHGVYVSGGRTSNVRILDCDVRGAGTGENIRIGEGVSETIVRGNHGGGLATGTVTLSAGANPAATVEGVSGDGDQHPSLRSDPVEAVAGTMAYDHYFVWDGEAGAWNLVFEWQRDPGTDVEIQYIVDSPRADLGERESGASGGSVPALSPGTYVVTSALNEQDIVMSVEGDLTDGANVYNDTLGEANGQTWTVTELEDGIYRIGPADAEDLVLEANDGNTDTGTNLVLGTWNDEDAQRWDVVGLGSVRGNTYYSLQPAHANLAVDVWEVDPDPGADLRFWNPTGANNQGFAFLEPDGE